MAYERFDVVVASFPFTDVAVSKRRPVLVLSQAAFNREHGHLIGCMITTGRESHWATDCPIRELAVAGLDKACVIRWKVFTLPLELVARKIGMLSPADRTEATTLQRQVLGESAN